MSKEASLDEIVSLCKRRGFIYQGSEVYGGLAGTWDYGPLGVRLKKNILDLWWKTFVGARDDMYDIDAAILMNPKVWQASGHVATFSDPLVECLNCHSRFRADHLAKDTHEKLEEEIKGLTFEKSGLNPGEELYEKYKTNVAGREVIDHDKLRADYPERYKITKSQFPDLHPLDLFGIDDEYEEDPYSILSYAKCSACGKVGEITEPRQFNMMFRTNVGPVESDESTSYLRPETAQGIFTNYKNIVDSFYPDLPFGVAQIGKAFRNEISPRDFIFRAREFEQMEIEYFIAEKDWEKEFEAWRKDIHGFLENLGLPKGKVHELEVPDNDRAHYSKRTIDFEFEFPIGKEELLGLAYRTDFDLQNIQKASGKNMEYRPKDGGEAFVPHVIEPSFGLERLIMAVLTSAYSTDEIGGEKRAVLKLPKELAPVQVAVSPLLKNKPELVKKAREVYAMLKKESLAVMWDDNGNIGKRYRRQDEIGTPHCVVIDFDTLEDDTVTVRDRDTTKQERVAVQDLIKKLS
jgi:glycyl-tRNA synthetase